MAACIVLAERLKSLIKIFKYKVLDLAIRFTSLKNPIIALNFTTYLGKIISSKHDFYILY